MACVFCSGGLFLSTYLNSGFGKPALYGALIAQYDAIYGIELGPERWELSKQLQNKWIPQFSHFSKVEYHFGNVGTPEESALLSRLKPTIFWMYDKVFFYLTSGK